jgi:beta-glucosidase
MVSPADLTRDQKIRLMSGADAWTTESLPGVRSVVVADGPHGLRVVEDALLTAGSEPATCFPPAVTMASSWDEDLIERVGAAVAVEAQALGAHVVLGPGLNIKRHPRGGRNFEYYSEDPLLSGRFAAAAVRGIQSQGVGACLKHFAVNNQEGHRFVVDAIVDERTLREIYLSGFEFAIAESKPWTIMCSYNRLNGEQVSENRLLLTDILRSEWGFDGVVMSDWSATGDRARGITAGLDLEMPGSKGLSDGETADALDAGTLTTADLDMATARLIALSEKAHHAPKGSIPVDEHDLLAREAAAAGTVLLTNDGILPLSRDLSVAVIGSFAQTPRYQGSGSSLVNSIRTTPALDVFREVFASVTYAAGYDPSTGAEDAELLAEAVTAAARADVAIVLAGLPGRYESEGFDRDHLSLPKQHDLLITAVSAANPRTVVALSNGSPVLMPWVELPAAIVESYLGGQASGGALVDVLTGDREPGGRLAETFPQRAADIASEPFFARGSRQTQHREGLFVGYRHATSAGLAPLFPFGHGLSYTSFDWTDIAFDDGCVRVTVTNTGERDGSDVVQVYRHDKSGVVLRPRRELVGFAKVHLAAGESRNLEIAIPQRAFEFYDVASSAWQVSKGEHDLEVGRSSSDIVATVTTVLTEGVTTSREPATTPAIATSDKQFTERLGHAIASPVPVRPFTRNSTIEELRTTALGKLFATAIWKAAPLEGEAQDDPAIATMLQRSFDEMPLRAVAMFSDGKLTWPVVDGLLDAFNGRPGKLLGRLIPRRKS